MAVNANKPERWKQDIAQSVDFYNDWFMRFAPKAYRETRKQTTEIDWIWEHRLEDLAALGL